MNTISQDDDGNKNHYSVNINDHCYARQETNNETEQVSENSVDLDADDTNWQVFSKRRSLDSMPNRNKKKPKQGTHTSDELKLSNSFEVLNDLDKNNMDADVSTKIKSDPKPPPIFIPDVGNVQAMIRAFESVVSTDEFCYRCVNRNSVKILPKSADVYRKLVRKLNEGNVSFHTYQLKQDRAYRVVLKNMHYSVDVNDIKENLSQMGHTVRNITNVLHSYSKKPLSMFFIDLEPRSNNKDIFNIQYLLHAKIIFEPPHTKREIVQCKRCQQYGHTKGYCRHPFRCVKCGKDHDTTKCTKDKSSPAVCALCGGDHPANYKGCAVFKSIQKKSHPPLREKTNKSNGFKETTSDGTSHSQSRPGLSYAEVAGNTRNNENVSAETTNSNLKPSDDVTNTITKFLERFENLFMQQSKQIGALLDLLTTVLKKLN